MQSPRCTLFETVLAHRPNNQDYGTRSLAYLCARTASATGAIPGLHIADTLRESEARHE